MIVQVAVITAGVSCIFLALGLMVAIDAWTAKR